MKTGDLIIEIKINYLYMAIDYKNACIIADALGTFANKTAQQDISQRFTDFILNPTPQEIDAILKGSPLPFWCTKLANQSSTNTAGLPPIPQPAPTSGHGFIPFPKTNPVYHIGTIFTNLKSNNLWIINKDQTREISLLWDGRTKTWAGSELFRQDNIKIGSTGLNQVTSKYVHTLTGVLPAAYPQWAKNMILGPTMQTLPKSGSTPQSSVKPASMASLQRLQDALLRDSKITKAFPGVDKRVSTCNHSFKEYTGFREVYSYCIYCDEKQDKPK